MTDMSTSTTRGSNGAGRVSALSPPVPRVAVRRNRARVGVGAVVMALAALAAVVLYTNVGHRRAVLAVARQVDPGQVIGDRDLREVRISSDPGLAPIAADTRASVVGRVADVRLVPGTLLTRAELTDGPALARGMALVGAVLKPGQYPLGLRVGDRVVLVAATSSSTGASGGTDQRSSATSNLPEATVAALERTAGASDTVAVSLIVSALDAPALADAGAAGRLELVVIGR